MSLAEENFHTIVARAVDRLPARIKDKMRNVAVLACDVVDAETVAEMALESDMDLLGLYQGVSLPERHNDAPFSVPDTVHLYRLPIEEEALESGKSVEDVVYETLWHEVGHHFGLDEAAVERREREEFNAAG